MDIPQPPDDYEVKNIIDKLANFVARNGLEFENMTKNKQKDNPKFSFLFRGQYYGYYHYKLTTEQQILNQQRAKANVQNVQDSIMQQTIQNAPWQQSYAPYNQSPMPPPPRGGMAIPPWQQQQQVAAAQQQQPPPIIAPSFMQQQQPRMQQQQVPPPSPQSMNPINPSMMAPSLSVPPQPLMMVPQQPTGILKEESELEKEEKRVEQQISESENNLKQQYQSLIAQQQDRIELELTDAEEAERVTRADKLGLELRSLDQILQPIIDSCTKDSIASGKTWILANSASSDHCVLIAKQLLYRVLSSKTTPGTSGKDGTPMKSFTVQLHLVYLINDVLHHASRRNLDQLLAAIEQVIIPIFCITHTTLLTGARDQEKESERLHKLLGLWNKFNYFTAETMQKLQNPEAALSEYQYQRSQSHSSIVEKVKTDIQKQYEQFERQHQEYADHIKRQILDKRQAFEDRKMHTQKPEQDPYVDRKDHDPANHYPADQNYQQQQNEPPPSSSGGPPPPWACRDKSMSDLEERSYENERNYQPPPRESDYRDYEMSRRKESDYDYASYDMGRRAGGGEKEYRSERHRDEWRDERVEDKDRWIDPYHGPPPSSNRHSHPPYDGPPTPSRPGGWMRRGPPPGGPPPPGPGGPPPPGPGGPRHPGGGPPGPRHPISDETLKPKVPYYDLPAGLMAPLVQLEDMEYKDLDPSLIRLPPPIPPSERLVAAVEAFYRPPSHDHPRNPDGWETNGLFEFFRAKVRAKRAYDNNKLSRSSSKSPSRSRSSSRSRSRSYSRSRSRSASRSRSNSRTPPKEVTIRSRRSRSRSIDRSSPVRISRSNAPTPPRQHQQQQPQHRLGGDSGSGGSGANNSSFNNGQSGGDPSATGRLSLDNPGAMMMKKMGWSGAGLGSKEQGIQDPVQAGEVRDNYDKFRGLGNDLKDPFENYRKSRSQGYINRIRKR